MARRVARSVFAGSLTPGFALLLWWVGVGQVARADRVLHEPVAVPRLKCQDGVCKEEAASSDAMPEAVVSRMGLVTAPSSSRSPSGTEQIFASGQTTDRLARSPGPKPGEDPAPIRRSRIFPDEATGPETVGERLYHEVFSPAVYPYKRMSVLDAVDEDGALSLRKPEPMPIEVAARNVGRERDPFYGSVVVDFSEGRPVPLPTPAAGFRVLSYRSTPTRRLQFYVDSAENLYVSSPTSGRHRLLVLFDAPPNYFAGPIRASSDTVRMKDLPRQWVPPLPRFLRREAERVLRTIGVEATPNAPYEAVLSQLVRYFRGFVVGDLPKEGKGSLYLRLSESKKGACRHRSYAFVVTALQAGIPARYVDNELHAFVEVWIPSGPGRGENGYYRRINLGGAPMRQRVLDANDRVAYQEKGEDPFPVPPEFQNGLPDQVIGRPQKASEWTAERSSQSPAREMRESTPKTPGNAGNSPGNAQKPATSDGAPGGTGGTSGTSAPKTGPAVQTVEFGKDTEASAAGESAEDGDEQAEDDPMTFEDRRKETTTPKIATRVSMAAPPRGYRGASFPVGGGVYVTSGDAAGLEVLLLIKVGASLRVIGRTVVEKNGRYEAQVELPKDIPVGKYGLFARVRGDKTRRGSASAPY